MSIRVSVVVPTYKRPALLHKCLDALTKQDFPSNEYEVIIVDDADSRETQSFVESFAVDSCPSISYAVARRTHGPATARNLGWRMARGEIIAFTDDDCLPEPDWLKEGVAALKEDMAGVSGQVIVPVDGNPTDYEKNVSRLMNCEFVTANCFYRRSALETSGGFDERFTMAWREDSDLFFTMLTLSCKVGYTSAAKVIHPVRSAPWGVSIKEQRKSMFNALLYKKYPNLYRRLVQSHPPLRYYGIVLSTIGFAVALLLDNRWIVLLLFLLWSGLVLQFAFQRLKNTKHSLSHILEMFLTSIVIPYLSVFWRLVGALKYRVWFF